MLPIVPHQNIAETYEVLLCIFSMVTAVVSYILSCR